MRYLLALLALSLLVALHELGHLVAARALGMRVRRYALGFGPAVLSLKRAGTEWVLGAVPFGASVQIHGMNPHEAAASGEHARAFATHPSGRRALVLAAGALANLLLALGVVLALYLSGTHVPVPMTVGVVEPGSEAARAQLLPGDVILRVDGEPLRQWRDFADRVADGVGRPLVLDVGREGAPRQVTVRPRADEAGTGRIGVGQQYVWRQLPPLEATGQAFRHLGSLVLEGLELPVRLLRGRGGGDALELAQRAHGAASTGADALLRVLARLSVLLALFYLLPVPGLDGGRLLFLALEASGRRVPARAETLAHTLGFVALLLLVVAVALTDVRRLWRQVRAGPTPAARPPALSTPDAGPPAVRPLPDAGPPAEQTFPDGGPLRLPDEPAD